MSEPSYVSDALMVVTKAAYQPSGLSQRDRTVTTRCAERDEKLKWIKQGVAKEER